MLTEAIRELRRGKPESLVEELRKTIKTLTFRDY